ncbi:18990_t:CDS:2, partial [Gigaspora margarita]
TGLEAKTPDHGYWEHKTTVIGRRHKTTVIEQRYYSQLLNKDKTLLLGDDTKQSHHLKETRTRLELYNSIKEQKATLKEDKNKNKVIGAPKKKANT